MSTARRPPGAARVRHRASDVPATGRGQLDCCSIVEIEQDRSGCCAGAPREHDVRERARLQEHGADDPAQLTPLDIEDDRPPPPFRGDSGHELYLGSLRAERDRLAQHARWFRRRGRRRARGGRGCGGGGGGCRRVRRWGRRGCGRGCRSRASGGSLPLVHTATRSSASAGSSTGVRGIRLAAFAAGGRRRRPAVRMIRARKTAPRSDGASPPSRRARVRARRGAAHAAPCRVAVDDRP